MANRDRAQLREGAGAFGPFRLDMAGCLAPSRVPPGPGSRTFDRLAAYFRSLFDSMSNHMAKSVNWSPEITSSQAMRGTTWR